MSLGRTVPRPLVFALVGLACSCAAPMGGGRLACEQATTTARAALELMAESGRDRTTDLRALVVKGYDTPFDGATVIDSFAIDGCVVDAAGREAELTVRFARLGRIEADAGRLSYVDDRREEVRRLRIQARPDGPPAVSDLSDFEPHVGRRYATSVFTEQAASDRDLAEQSRRAIAEIERR